MLNLKRYINKQDTYGEQALVNLETNEIILKGDYYHDKIAKVIDGFLMGLDYTKTKYEINIEYINEEECSNLPFTLDFYYEDEVPTRSNSEFVVDYSCNGMNEKDDDEIEKNNTTTIDDDDDDDKVVEIDDINAFLSGAYDKSNVDTSIYTRKKEQVYENKYRVETIDIDKDFYAETLETALLSADNYYGTLYKYDEFGNEKMIFSANEDCDVNTELLKEFGIMQVYENDERIFIYTNTKQKITIKPIEYIRF